MCRERVLPELPRSLRDPGGKESEGETSLPQQHSDHLKNSSQQKPAAVTHSWKSRDGRNDGRTDDVSGTIDKCGRGRL